MTVAATLREVMPVPARVRTASLIAAALLAAGCGSQPPSAQPGAAVAASAQPAGTAEPTGPCDKDHEDQAITLARSALHRRLGQLPLSKPLAEYEHVFLSMQVPGRPAPVVSVGWMVSFLVNGAAADQPVVSADAQPPASVPPAPRPASSQSGGAELSLPDAAASTPPPPGSPAPAVSVPLLPGVLPSGAPVPAMQRPVIANSELGSAPTDRRLGEFVHVDGTVTDM